MSFSFLLIFILVVFWRPQEWLLPFLYGWPILDAVVYGSVLALLLEIETPRVSFDSRRPQPALYCGLFAAALMSHLAHGYLQGILDNWFSAFRICFFGILLSVNLTNTVRLRWIVRVFVVMSLFMAVHAILQQRQGVGFGGLEPVMSWRPGVEEMVPRAQFFGIFGDPNDMAQMFATSMPLCFLLFRKHSFLTTCIGLGMCYVFYLGVEACWSRGAYVAVLSAVGTILVVKLFSAKKRPWFLVFGICAGLLLVPLMGFEESALDRVNFWGEANWQFLRNPIFGVGYNFIGEYIRGRAAHSAFVTCYSELGLFGYFFWFTLIISGVVGALRARKALELVDRDAEENWLYRYSCFGVAAFVGFCVSSFFLSRAFVFPMFFLMSMLGATPFIAEDLLRRQSSQEEPMEAVAMTNRDIRILGMISSPLSIAYIYVAILLINKMR